MGVTAYKRVQKAASASGNYLQIQAKTDRPKVLSLFLPSSNPLNGELAVV